MKVNLNTLEISLSTNKNNMMKSHYELDGLADKSLSAVQIFLLRM